MFRLDTVLASVSMKHITADVILRNLIKFPTTYYVSRWPLSDVENSRPRKHWLRKRSLYITRKALRLFLLLLSKQFSLCFSNTFMRAVGWANVSDTDLIFNSMVFAINGNLQNKTTFSVCICRQNCDKNASGKRIKIVFWTWLQVVFVILGGSRWF